MHREVIVVMIAVKFKKANPLEVAASSLLRMLVAVEDIAEADIAAEDIDAEADNCQFPNLQSLVPPPFVYLDLDCSEVVPQW